MLQIRIVENHLFAHLAACKLRTKKGMAITIGNTIYLHKTTTKQLIEHTSWFRHELKHIEQFQQYGCIGFIIRYLWESLRNGYFNNKYEIEARNNELINPFITKYKVFICK
jgi:hypothetical protein